VAEVFVLYADPERLRHGTGTILLGALSRAQMGMGASEQWLSVTKGNELGLPFYRAQGFVVVEEVEPWDGAGVEDGVRSLRMCRALREPRLT
jgi:ribosomal protein S18 acetylase RimI-like enzyme